MDDNLKIDEPLGDTENVYGPAVREQLAVVLADPTNHSTPVAKLLESVLGGLGFSSKWRDFWFRTPTNSRLENPENLSGETPTEPKPQS